MDWTLATLLVMAAMGDPAGMAHPQVWLARHGETDWSAAGRHTGLTDVSLNDAGRDAARTLGTLLAGQQFDAVLTSPLRRAVDTCAIAGYAAPAQVDDDLREWDYGDYEGVTTTEIRQKRPDWSLFVDGCPNGESIDDVVVRADRVIGRVREMNGSVLVFGHGHSLRVLAVRWIGLSGTAGAHLVLATATLSQLGWERETPAIIHWNGT
jgi:probable phosphoglycerate mutase